MHLLQVIILGIIQGATEFIPVSSSGHLVLLREIFHWQEGGIALDIVLHFATLLALVFYFRKKIWQIIVGLAHKRQASWRLFSGIILATLPAVLAGYFTADWIEQYFRSAGMVGLLMILVGIIFILTERRQKRREAVVRKEVLVWQDYLWIGLAQAVALLPGVSRSGTTISAGMWRKMARAEAAEFSFLLAIPAILGATFYDLLQNGHTLALDFYPLMLGSVFAFLVGYLSIHFLMRYLAQHKLNLFAYYLLTIGFLAIIFSLWR